MKNFTTRMMITAAALVAAASAASAQSMEAKIPFAFRSGEKVMAAGTYRVTVREAAAGELVEIKGARGDQHSYSLAYSNGPAKAAWRNDGQARLIFTCGVSRCVLTDVWMGSSSETYRVHASSFGKDEPVNTAEVVLHPAKAD